MQFDLVFEGGGAKGMAFVGAIEALRGHGHTVDRLLGTSAGAITALFLAVEYSNEELNNALNETDDRGKPIFVSFMAAPRPFSTDELATCAMRRILQDFDAPLLPNWAEQRMDDALLKFMAENPLARHLLNFIERGGWYSADPFVRWLERNLDRGEFRGRPRRFSAMNFAEFYEATGHELTVVAADATAARLLALNRNTAPDLPVKWAVRMSMSVPLLWEEVIWREEWGAYRGQTDIVGNAIVDGGLLSNFSIELFLSKDEFVQKIMGAKRSENVLGFLIDETLPVPGAPPAAVPAQVKGVDVDELPPVRRLKRLVDTATQAHDKLAIQEFEQFVVRLPAQGYSFAEFDMSPARRDALIRAAREKTERYLLERFPPQPPIAGQGPPDDSAFRPDSEPLDYRTVERPIQPPVHPSIPLSAEELADRRARKLLEP